MAPANRSTALDIEVYKRRILEQGIRPLSDDDFTSAVVQDLRARRIIDHVELSDHRVVFLCQHQNDPGTPGVPAKNRSIFPVYEEDLQQVSEPKVLEYWNRGYEANGKNREAQLGGIEVFFVFRILEHNSRKRELLVQWVGYTRDDATWLPAWRVLDFARDIVKEYLDEHNLTQYLKIKKSFRDVRSKQKLASKQPPLKRLQSSNGRHHADNVVHLSTVSTLAKAVEDAANASTSAMQLATAVDMKLEKTREEILQVIREELSEQDEQQNHRIQRLEQDVTRLYTLLNQRKPLRKLFG